MAALQLIAHDGAVLSTWPYPTEYRARVARKVAEQALDRRALTLPMLAEHHGMPSVLVRADMVSHIRLIPPEPMPSVTIAPFPADTDADDHYDYQSRAAGERNDR